MADRGYDAHRDRVNQRDRSESKRGREVGPLRPVRDPERRERGRLSLEAFCLEYFPGRFPLPFAAMHRTAIDRLERVTAGGGRFACALPRGSGKTTLAEVAVLRAVLYGFRRFAVLIAATERHAARAIDRLKAELEQNDALDADFPEACQPIRGLERIVNRTRGQLLDGEPTRIEWTADAVRLPTVPGKLCSGSVIQAVGLTGAVRGLAVLGPDGQPVRPDLVLLDDVQTRESAKSPTQTADREAIITDDVLGLAGPTTEIAAVMLATVIFPTDLSDRFLSPDRHPEWQGVRTKLLAAFPDRMDLWDGYAEMRRESFRAGDEGRRATAFYVANRADMDAGAAVTWADRFGPGQASGVQAAMDLFFDNPRGFRAEYQNEPLADDLAPGGKELVPAAVAGRLTGVERLAVPRECGRLTAFVDVGGGLHWYCVAAWDERFGGSVIDYGCWPRQTRSVFAAADARPSLADRFPGHAEAQRVYAGLAELTAEVLGRAYPREGGGEVRVSRCLVDAGWQPDAVQRFVRASPHAGVLFASKGVGRSATAVGVARWKPRPGERSGWHWRLTAGERGFRLVQFDPDAWKSFLFDRLTTAPGGPGCVQLYGRSAVAHELFAEHCGAEAAEPVTMRGETWDKWLQRPDRPDNHLWDAVVGCCVAASVDGLVFHPGGPAAPPPAKPSRVKLSEVQARRRKAAVP